jgi:DNA-binding CsgD family transcriptional regulator
MQSDPALWQQAGDDFEASPDAYRAAYCRWREAEALLEGGGSRARAKACLDIARQNSRALRTAPLTARIEALALRCRIELRTADAPSAPNDAAAAAQLGITPREVEILAHLAAGASDREIAEALFISKKTVSVHVSNVLRKLRVSNRIEAGKIGQRHGLLPAGLEVSR